MKPFATYPEYTIIQEDHDYTGNVKRRQTRKNYKVTIEEHTLIWYPVWGIVKAQHYW